MLLSDTDIEKYITSGEIKISPKPDFHSSLGTCSLDLRLGNVFRVFNHNRTAVIDPLKKIPSITEKITVLDNKQFILHPGEFVLGVTKEYVELPNNISARLEGRSSLGRLGIIIHSTAGSVAAGWKGNLTLELTNVGKIPVILHPGMRICALAFEKLSSPALGKYYQPKYSGQLEPEESRMEMET